MKSHAFAVAFVSGFIKPSDELVGEFDTPTSGGGTEAIGIGTETTACEKDQTGESRFG